MLTAGSGQVKEFRALLPGTKIFAASFKEPKSVTSLACSS